MAVARLTSTDTLIDVKEDHFEIFTFIWLDADVHAIVNQNIQQGLCSIVNNFKRFQDGDVCKQYIERRKKHDRLVLIVSSQLARQVVPSIHERRQVSAIYVISMEEKSDEQWTHEFAKVRLF